MVTTGTLPNQRRVQTKRVKIFKSRVLTEDIVKMTGFVFENNLFQFNSQLYKQIPGINIKSTFYFFGLSWNRYFRGTGQNKPYKEEIANEKKLDTFLFTVIEGM